MIQILINTLFFVFAFRCILFWTYLWQLKEYRLDRLFVHMKDTEQGRKTLFSYEELLLFIVFLLYILGIFVDFVTVSFSFIIIGLFGILAVRALLEVVNRKIKRPVFTIKALCVIGISTLLVVLFMLFPLTEIAFWLILIALLIPFIVAFVVFLFAFPTEIYTDWYVQRAKTKRKSLKTLQVIAISGSYGKSSTKEVVSNVLSQKYRVVKTAFSNNTPLAIAKTLLAKVDETTDFFIVELGAYKKGEIRQLAQMVGPTISITTAISDQHLALYGEMKDVIASELELIHELPKNALVLLNGTHDGMKLFAEKIKIPLVMWYKVVDKTKNKHVASASEVMQNKKGVSWNFSYENHTIKISSPLLGRHTVENILPAVLLGLQFGLTASQIQKGISSLLPLPKTMEQVDKISGVTCIDDSFNASPESVFAAIDYLSLFPKKKLLVLSPLIELGEMSQQRHIAIGRELTSMDVVFLTNKNFISQIRQGITEKKGTTRLITGSYRYLAKQVHEIAKKGDAVVFEGKEAGVVLHFL